MKGTPSRGQIKITSGALILLIATVVPSLLFLMSEGDLRLQIARFAVATGDSLWRDLKVWQVVTSPLLELEFIGVIFTGLMLWLFFPTLEKWWGKKRFLLFALYTSIAGTVTGTLVGLLVDTPNAPVFGLAPFVFAGMLAFGLLFAKEQVRFFGVLPMTGQQVVIGVTALMLAFVVIGQDWARGAANLGAMALAWLMCSGKWTPKLWWLKRKQKRIRRHLKLVKDDQEPKKWLN